MQRYRCNIVGAVRCGLRPAAFLSVGVAFAILTSVAARVLVDYVDDEVELEEGRAWRALFIGEEVSAGPRYAWTTTPLRS